MQNIFSAENWLLIIIAVIWLAVAVVMDFRKREVENWWNFSFIIIAMAYRAFVSAAELSIGYFMIGITGLAAFFLISNILYYSRIFAGGDSKLMYGLGAAIPFVYDLSTSMWMLGIFIICFLVSASLYGGVYTFILAVIHRKKLKKEFAKQLSIYKNQVLIVCIASGVAFIVSALLGIYIASFLAMLVFLAAFLLVYARALEEVCMVRSIDASKLTFGDWIAKPVKVHGRTIKPYWEGVSEKELEFIQKYYKGKVVVKYGIPFTPAFLLGFIGMLLIFRFLIG